MLGAATGVPPLSWRALTEDIMPDFQVGVDVGGTFTDVVVHGSPDQVVVAKVLSTPNDPYDGVLDGIRKAMARASGELTDVTAVRHGTTIATNAIVERKVAQTALIVTKGFRDILYVQRQVRPSLYDLRMRHPRPLVPRELTFEVTERTTWSGLVENAVVEAEVDAIADALVEHGIEAVAVCLLHSYANQANEERVRAVLKRRLPDLSICLSAEICPQIGEYERTSTTVANACVAPAVARYVAGLQDELHALGPHCHVYIMQSNGGAMGPEMATSKSVHTMYSGPAGGLMGARFFAQRAGIRNAITLDVGGTSADVGVIIDGELQQTREGRIGGLPIRIPLLEIHVVGAGGGSIAWPDWGGALRVGPRSAGSTPGPVCYGLGGTEPTVTDAHVALGHIGTEVRLGGSVSLDAAAAIAAIETRIAVPLRLTVQRAAEGMIDVVNATMERAIRVLTVGRGLDPKDFALLAFGGAGPLHAAALARSLGIATVIVPPYAGVLSAIGMLAATIQHDFARTQIALVGSLTRTEVHRAYSALENEAAAVMRREGFAPQDIAFERWMELRYVGQAFELMIRPVRLDMLDNPPVVLAEVFHTVHRNRYGFAHVTEPIEAVQFGITALGHLPQFNYSPTALLGDTGTPQIGERPAVFAGRVVTTPVLHRERLGPGMTQRGPAIIEGDDSTAVLPEESVATLDDGEILTIRFAGGTT
jgi:N-methylhydantoinase A